MGLERVVLAFENENTSRKVRALLEGAGLARGLICRTAAEVRLLLGQQQIPTVVCGYKLPDATAEELFFDLPAGRTMVLVAPENLLSLCGRSDGLVTPLSRNALLEGVERALGLAQSVRLSVRPAGEEELIRRAKEWLMEQRGMDEGQAHRLLQQRSMICGRKLAETARLLLEREAGLALYG